MNHSGALPSQSNEMTGQTDSAPCLPDQTCCPTSSGLLSLKTGTVSPKTPGNLPNEDIQVRIAESAAPFQTGNRPP